LISLLITLLGIALAVRLSLAQAPQPGEASVEGESGPAVVTLSYVPIQGRLTDTGGNALNGNYSITANIYDATSGGSVICSYSGTASVTNGLFVVNMLCYNQMITGQSLYLGVKVGSDAEMTPRQPIYPVPYAITVAPGAVIQGETSYLFVPGTAFNKNQSSDSTAWTSTAGSVNIYSGTPGTLTRSIRIPITIPAVLYGQPVRVTNARVYYKCLDGADNYITDTQLYKQTDADSYVSLIDDDTDRQSNTATSYSLSTNATYNTLSSSEGILTLRLGLTFHNESDYITIAGVRLTLETTY
jgi:hypothetical protein